MGSVSHRFTGHDWDGTSQVYFAPYRYYAPETARWTTRDPLGMVDGPNIYAYVGNEPINNFDPSGMNIVIVLGGAAAAAAAALKACSLAAKCSDCMLKAKEAARSYSERIDWTDPEEVDAFQKAQFGAECGSLCGQAGKAIAKAIFDQIKKGGT